jgi:ankyrin repeat protein
MLLQKGAKVNQCGIPSPLIVAIHTDDPLIVEVLLDNNAYVNPPNTGFYRPPLFEAISRGHIDIVKMLLERRAYMNKKYRGLARYWGMHQIHMTWTF